MGGRFKRSGSAFKRRGTGDHSLGALNDILFPKGREIFQEESSQLVWSAGKQYVANYIHMTVAKVQQLMAKGADLMNVAKVSSVAANRADTQLKYLGGTVKHTFVNNSNHTAVLHLYESANKGYHSRDPANTWEEDLNHDQSRANSVAPIDVEKNTDDVPGSNFPFKNSHPRLAHFFRRKESKRVTLAPGESFVYTVRRAPFTIGSKKLDFGISDESGTPTAGAGFFTTHLTVVAYSQLVNDSADDSVNYGSGHINHVAQEINNFRAAFPSNGVQVFNHGALGTITGTEQHMDPTDRDLNDYLHT